MKQSKERLHDEWQVKQRGDGFHPLLQSPGSRERFLAPDACGFCQP